MSGSASATLERSFPYCIATVVTSKAIDALLEGGGEGHYRHTHPWLVAAQLLAQSNDRQQILPILFANQSEQTVSFTHWSVLTNIDVVELHRGQWESRASFTALMPMNPIWESIDSVFVKASDEQLRREEIEGIRVFRTALDEHHIHPYAICETPTFVSAILESGK